MQDHLNRTLKLVEKLTETVETLQNHYTALCEELDRSYAGIDQDFSSVFAAMRDLADQTGSTLNLDTIEEDERGAAPDEPEQADEIVYVSADKKVLH